MAQDISKMETTQTAVVWLEHNIQSDMIFMEIMGLIRQAKEMEKEQMINAGNKCAQMHKEFVNMLDCLTTDELYAMEISTTTFGEQYYNQTYGEVH